MRSALARVSRKRACTRTLLAWAPQGFALRAGLLLGALSACTAPHTLITARHTTCKPREIQISNLTYSGSDEDWVATCRGHKYLCRTRENGRRLKYGCTLSAEPATPVPDAGVAR